jgi:hypothetical protein
MKPYPGGLCVGRPGVPSSRALYPQSSLADLYDPLAMPKELRQAHTQLDKAVDACYGRTDFKNEADRVTFLFELYQQYTATLLPPAPKLAKGRRKKAS